MHHSAPHIRLPLQWDAVLTHVFLAVSANALSFDYSSQEQRSFSYYCPGSNQKRLSRAGTKPGYRRITNIWKHRPPWFNPLALMLSWRWPFLFLFWCHKVRKYGRVAQDSTSTHQVSARLLPTAAHIHPNPFLAAAEPAKVAPTTFKQFDSSKKTALPSCDSALGYLQSQHQLPAGRDLLRLGSNWSWVL